MDPDPANFMVFDIVLLILLLFVYGFLALAKAAVWELSENELEEQSEDGDKKATRLLKYHTEEDNYKARISFFRIIALCLFIFFSEKAFSPLFAKSGYERLVSLGVVLVASLIAFTFGTIIPQKIGYEHSTSLASKGIAPLDFLLKISFPLYIVCDFFANLGLRIFGGNPDAQESVTEEDILSLVEESEEMGFIDDSQRDMINNIFEFDDISVGDVMTHRQDVSAIELSDSLEETIELAIAKGFSRIPVFEEDLDKIVGILYVKDLLPYVGKKIPKSVTPAEFMRSVFVVPETKRCGELFEEMTEKRLQMAVVVDEFGGTAGVVTLEDLIESILGNIQDEYDSEEKDAEEIIAEEDASFTIEGTCDIEEVEQMLDISLPEGDYDTLGGFLISVLERIPSSDEQPEVESAGYLFKVMSVADLRIDKVRAEKLPEIEEEE